ncbi:hypothetical protein [Xanthomonas arboricola]|uniref:hypothetical protein n=1 Tax=Xanthomonas arboricola TaxID=56448 RepID=UPI00118CB466|nr:hypothetical protein [Xanthomonas arboricola]QDS17492.1 hypothetical protein FPL04_19055 [Xanthomonas arboricola]
MIETWIASQATLQAAWIGAGATAAVGIVTVVTALCGISLQLKNDRLQRAKDRRHQSAKDTILAAVAGMTEVSQASAMLADPSTQPAEAFRDFTAALAKINAAGAVASLDAVKAGKSYLAVVGPIFSAVRAKRMLLESSGAPNEEWTKLAFAVLDLHGEYVLPQLHKAIAMARLDLEIADDDLQEFFEALTPDLQAGQANLAIAWDRLGLTPIVAVPDLANR